MKPAATSLKLPVQLKKRLQRLANRTGESAHALMLRALREHVDATELFDAFIEDAAAADAEMQRSNEGYPMTDVHRWVRGQVAGKSTPRPKAVSWRR